MIGDNVQHTIRQNSKLKTIEVYVWQAPLFCTILKFNVMNTHIQINNKNYNNCKLLNLVYFILKTN